MSKEIARCRREAAEAAEEYRRTGDRGAYLGCQDWQAEEIEILRAMERGECER